MNHAVNTHTARQHLIQNMYDDHILVYTTTPMFRFGYEINALLCRSAEYMAKRMQAFVSISSRKATQNSIILHDSIHLGGLK